MGIDIVPNPTAFVRAVPEEGAPGYRGVALLVVHSTAHLGSEVADERGIEDGWARLQVVHTSAPIGGVVPAEDAVDDGGAAALISHSSAQDRGASGDGETPKDGIRTLATHTAHDALGEAGTVDDRCLGSVGAAQLDGLAHEIDEFGVDAGRDDDLVARCCCCDGTLNRGVISGNLNDGRACRAAKAHSEDDESECRHRERRDPRAMGRYFQNSAPD